MHWIIDDVPGHLLVTVEGEWLVRQALQMFDEVERICRARGCERGLLDFRASTGLVSESEKFLAGSDVAHRFEAARVAAVFSPGARITGFAENVAARRGGSLLVTDDMTEAERYLGTPLHL